GPRFLRLWVMVAGGAPWAGFTGMGGPGAANRGALVFPLFSTLPLTTAPPAQGPRFLRLWVMVAGGAPWAGFTGMGGPGAANRGALVFPLFSTPPLTTVPSSPGARTGLPWAFRL
ncbi:MAG: hypothetical protein ACOZCE_13675, partial [Spirochaetota bacterium]